MKEKNERAERLYEELGGISEKHIEEALTAQTAQNAPEKTRARFLTPARKRILVAVACILLVAATVVALWGTAYKPQTDAPTEVPTHGGDGSVEASEPAERDPVVPKLDSIDKVIYYGAMAALEQKENDSLRSRAKTVKKAKIAYDDTSDEIAIDLPETAGNTPTIDPYDYPEPIPSPEREPGEGTEVLEVLDLTNTRFSFIIRQIYYFEFDLEEDGFLASKIGSGHIIAVITVNNINHMLTFHNEETNRFYSCFANKQGDFDQVWYCEYSTQRYIEGDRIMLDMSTNGLGFIIGISGSSPGELQIECFYTKPVVAGDYGAINIDDRPLDGGIPTSKVEYRFGVFRYSITELQDYLNKKAFGENGTTPDPVDPSLPVIPTDDDPTLTPVDYFDYETFDYESDRADAFLRQAAGEATVYEAFYFADDASSVHYLPELTDAKRFAETVLEKYGFDLEGRACSCAYCPSDNGIWRLDYLAADSQISVYVSYWCAIKMVVAYNDLLLRPTPTPEGPNFDGLYSYDDFAGAGWTFNYESERAELLARKEAGDEKITFGNYRLPEAQYEFMTKVWSGVQTALVFSGQNKDARVDMDARMWKIVLKGLHEPRKGEIITAYVSFDGVLLIAVTDKGEPFSLKEKGLFTDYIEEGAVFDYESERADVLAREAAGEDGIQTNGFIDWNMEFDRLELVRRYASDLGCIGKVTNVRVDPEKKVWRLVYCLDWGYQGGGDAIVYISYDGIGLMSIVKREKYSVTLANAPHFISVDDLQKVRVLYDAGNKNVLTGFESTNADYTYVSEAIGYAYYELLNKNVNVEGFNVQYWSDIYQKVWKLRFVNPNDPNDAVDVYVYAKGGCIPFAFIRSTSSAHDLKPWLFNDTWRYDDYKGAGFTFNYESERAEALARTDGATVTTGGFPALHDELFYDDADVISYIFEELGVIGRIEDVRVDEQQKIWKVVLYVDDGLVGGRKTVYVWEWGVAVLMVEEPMD